MSSSGETILNNRYALKAQQGSGGMAVIYRAVDLSLGRTVAVKILRPSLTSDPSFLTRFRNEARAVANLSHPNIVTVHDVGSDGPTHYIVMEYVEGQDLKKIIRAEGMLSVKRSLHLAIQICAGIGFAHRAQLVHADVKPQNILVTNDDRVKVTDFGIAQALSDTQPTQRQDVVWGSPHYFAPEQARGEKPTPYSDVYAIGIVMFEMLTGRLPFTGSTQQELAMAHVRDRVPLVTEFNPNVPEGLAKIIYKVMSKEPSARYRMADQLGHILESYQKRSLEEASGASSASARPLEIKPSPAPTLPPPSTLPPVGGGPSSPPPPPGQSQPRPPVSTPPRGPVQFPPVPSPAPSETEPTQRYGPAPVAPQPVEYNRSPRPVVVPGIQTQDSRPDASPWPPVESDSRRLQSQPFQPIYPEPEAQSGLDIVTILLAVIAILAVACLIPLYIAVFQARFGG